MVWSFWGWFLYLLIVSIGFPRKVKMLNIVNNIYSLKQRGGWKMRALSTLVKAEGLFASWFKWTILGAHASCWFIANAGDSVSKHLISMFEDSRTFLDEEHTCTRMDEGWDRWGTLKTDPATPGLLWRLASKCQQLRRRSSTNPEAGNCAADATLRRQN